MAYKQGRSYPPAYWLMCAGALLFFLSFHMIIPELYNHLSDLKRPDLQGWVIGSFAFSSLVARPFSGWFCDNVGRKLTMIIGLACCLLAALGYLFVSLPLFFILLRIIHGLSAGFAPTGFTAFTTDVIHPEKRGRAMGWQGMFSNIGAALGFGFGTWFVLHFGRQGLYLFSALLALVALIFFCFLPETRPVSHERNKFGFKIERLFYYPAWQPFIIMLLICIPYGILIPAVKDYSTLIHINNPGLYFLISITSSLLIRIAAGVVTDKIGRIWGVVIGTFFQFMGMGLLGLDRGGNLFEISAVCYGIGQGFTSPSLFSWAGDLGLLLYRGRALSTLFIALELGIVMGGVIVSNTVTPLQSQLNFEILFPVCTAFTGLAFVASLFFQYRSSGSKQ